MKISQKGSMITESIRIGDTVFEQRQNEKGERYVKILHYQNGNFVDSGVIDHGEGNQLIEYLRRSVLYISQEEVTG